MTRRVIGAQSVSIITIDIQFVEIIIAKERNNR